MNICVYGAASTAIDASYPKAGLELGKAIARRGHKLVFGGGQTGMMGAVASGVRAENGKILGVAPRFFDTEGVLFQECDEFRFTETMRERKQIMEDESDAFVMSPGGLGTLEEFFEIVTLKQLGRHQKPIVIFNIRHYFDPLIELLARSADEHFMEPENMQLFAVCETAEEVLDYLEQTER